MAEMFHIIWNALLAISAGILAEVWVIPVHVLVSKTKKKHYKLKKSANTNFLQIKL